MARWLLVRRSRGDGQLAFYACFGPAPTSLLGLVRVAGSRSAVVAGGASFTQEQASALLAGLPGPDQVRASALAYWGFEGIAREYERVYVRVRDGEHWT